MLRIESKRYGEDVAFMRVTDGAHDVWTFEVDEDWNGCGAGARHVWVGDRNGTINIFDVAARRKSAEVSIPSSREWRSRSTSKDGCRLYVFQPIDELETSTLHVVDLAAGRIIASHPEIPGFLQNYPNERADGRLLLSLVKRPSVTGITIVTIDPSTGVRTVETLGDGPPSDRVLPSPDGRYLLRRDATQLPRRTVGSRPQSILSFGRKGSGDGEIHYGIVWQLWEASPLRFVDRFVTQWMKPDELLDAFYFGTRLPPDQAATCRRELWDAIAAAMAAANAPPSGGPPTRKWFRSPLAENDESWQLVQATLDKLRDHDGISDFKGWQPDGDAFWVAVSNYLTCVGLDGSTSPRLYLERMGTEANKVVTSAHRFEGAIPLDGRTAEVRYSGGKAVFDGAPSAEIVHAISLSADHWRPAPAPPRPDPRGNVLAIPLAEWSTVAVEEAIDTLAEELTPDLAARAIEGEIRLSFPCGDGGIAEAAFFDRVADEFPDAAPALRRLVDRFVRAVMESEFLFSDAANGKGFLSHGVLALGLLDAGALPLVQSYGRVVDREHESDFVGMVVPRIIEAHGWTDAMIDFVFWVLIRNYFNILQDYNVVWRDWGLGKALSDKDPSLLAAHIVGLYRRDLTSGRFAVGRRKGGLAQLEADIPKAHEPWLVAFLKEAKRRLAD